MNPFVKKEIRLLLPSWMASMLLALSAWLLPEHLGSRPTIISILFVFPFLFCPLMLIMTVLGSFGRELSFGTFSILLAQPVSRARIWWTKTLLPAFGVLIVWLVWCYSQIASNQINANVQDTEISTALFALAIYSGGLWTVLLLRQVAAAFWFTVLIPSALFMTVFNLLGHYPDNVVAKVLIVVFIIYGIAGYWFAYRLFMRAQDAQWSGSVIVMPKVRGLPAWLSMPARKRLSHPHAALWRKEFQLHQSQFVMALALVVMNLAIIITRKLGHFPQNSGTQFVLETFWVLWLVIPYLVGCAAAAEERKLGTHEGQLCLPAKWRMQFAVKLCVVLLLSLLFGVAVPLLLEGTRVLPDAHIKLFDAFSAQFNGEMFKTSVMQTLNQNSFWNCIGQINHIMPLLTLAGIATGIGVVSFYISSLARNTLQALGPAALGLIAFAFLMMAAQVQEFTDHPLWHGELIYFIGLPVMLLTLLILAFRNFRHLATGWQLWLRNLLTLTVSLAFVVVATAVIYHRAWGKLTPFEPAHGPARLALTNPASLSEHWDEISVRLPDGRIWMAHFTGSSFSSSPVAFALGDFTVAVDAGSFIEGSNWATVKLFQRGLVGIKTDGTLWVSENPLRASGFQVVDRKKNEAEMRHLAQFGNETNWNSLQPVDLSVLLVKDNGTLWRWGPTAFDFRHKQWPGLRSFMPHQLGTESNWAELFESSYQTFLRKRDGSIWVLSYDSLDTNGIIRKLDGLILRAVAGSSLDQFRSVATVTYGPGFRVGIRSDGTFRIWAERHFNPGTRQVEWSVSDLPIGHETNWLAVAGSERKMVTLKDDGSLWLWDFSWNPLRVWYGEAEKHRMQKTIPVRLGTHADWISVTSARSGIISLAADGSLWFWPLSRPSYYSKNGQRFEPLLDTPRKPVYLGNIFGKTN